MTGLYFQRALYNLYLEKYVDAFEDANIALEPDPNNKDVLVIKYFSLGMKGEYDSAIKGFNNMIKLHPKQLDIIRMKGLLCSLNRDWKGITEVEDEILSINARDAEVYFEQGKIYLDRGYTKSAFECFENAVKIDKQYRSRINDAISSYSAPQSYIQSYSYTPSIQTHSYAQEMLNDLTKNEFKEKVGDIRYKEIQTPTFSINNTMPNNIR